ncbi:DUF2523 family protein [Dyella sp. ASV21]|uniref:DUF2523 family protein n=1 Tax=Dyella sp. ASV21 TaxID=2795114 RepID=UPI0018EE1325|nr:DUF2523 family protein [Dyella sp. ASV21]
MGAIIQLLGRMLLWLVSTYAGQWVLKVLVTLGLTVVVTKVGLPALMSFVQSQMSGWDPFLFQAFGAFGGDVYVSMVISALVARATGSIALKAVTNA